MKQDIIVSLIQSDIIWEKVNDNLKMYSDILGTIDKKTDLIILPEMFTTGFTMNCCKLAERMGEETMMWMEKWSRKLDCVIAGSIIISDQGRFYNRLIWMRPDCSFLFYDKRHLFRMADEHLWYTSGNSKLIATLKEWNICPLTCYDLRFPVWSKNRYLNFKWEYDMLIYIANWPSVRDTVWCTLLKARAIENQAFVVGVNRTGTDGKNISYSGGSMAVDLTGKIIASCIKGKTDVKTIQLSHKELNENRDRLDAGKDWDQFSIIV